MVLAVWALAMLGVAIMLGVSFDAPHAREGGLGAALAALWTMAFTVVTGTLALTSAAMHWRRNRHAMLPKALAAMTLAALLGGGAMRVGGATLGPASPEPPPEGWVMPPDPEIVLTPDEALIAAIDGNEHARAAALLEEGADPNACNDVDQCAVTLAVFRRATGTLRALAAHGADLNVRHGLERAWPLQLALEDTWGRDTVVVLLSLGANLPYRDLTADVAARGAEAVADELIAAEPF